MREIDDGGRIGYCIRRSASSKRDPDKGRRWPLAGTCIQRANAAGEPRSALNGPCWPVSV
jgi:hypothetical protein